jgi:hypothetical protein
MGGFYQGMKIPKELNVEQVSDEGLLKYHDEIHIYWSKLEEGYRLDWSFLELYMLHSQLVREMGKREVPHLAPINDLDKVIAS